MRGYHVDRSSLPSNEEPGLSALGEAALEYSRMGWPVFPVEPRGKQPLVKNWQSLATTNPEQLVAWWTRWSDANIGYPIRVGEVVVDVDGPTDAEVPPTLRSLTSKGSHNFYVTAREIRQGVRVAENIDTRTTGKGFVVLPPSIHASGHVYAWDASGPEERAPAPAWLYEAPAAPGDARVFTVHDRPLWEAALAGERAWHDTELISYAGHLRKVGNSEADILVALKGTGATHHDGRPYLDDRDRSYERLARSGARYAAGTTPPPQGRGVEYIRASDVQMEPVDWLWEHRLPKGHLTLVDGPPGHGKSTWTLAVIGIATSGSPWPDGSPGSVPINCAIFTTEDDAQTTVVPRLAFAGANLERVHIYQAHKDDDGTILPLTIPEDLLDLERSWVEHDIKLVVFDPLGAWYGPDVNSNIDADVRRALGPLFMVINKLGIVCIGIRHFTKGHQPLAAYRGGGSVGGVAQARMGYHFMENPDRPEEVLLAQAKGNLGPEMPTLAFSRESGTIETPEGKLIEVYRLTYAGERHVTAQELNVERKGPPPTLRTEAEALLQEMLADGPRMARDVAAAAKARSISEKTLNRARKSLKVKAEQRAVGWTLSLPDNIWSEPSRPF